MSKLGADLGIFFECFGDVWEVFYVWGEFWEQFLKFREIFPRNLGYTWKTLYHLVRFRKNYGELL